MCQDILARCPMHRELVTKQLNACKPVLDWNGQGNPPMCPEACMNISRAIEDLPNAERLACCDCGEGAPGMLCNMTRMKLGAACGVCSAEALAYYSLGDLFFSLPNNYAAIWNIARIVWT